MVSMKKLLFQRCPPHNLFLIEGTSEIVFLQKFHSTFLQYRKELFGGVLMQKHEFGLFRQPPS